MEKPKNNLHDDMFLKKSRRSSIVTGSILAHIKAFSLAREKGPIGNALECLISNLAYWISLNEQGKGGNGVVLRFDSKGFSKKKLTNKHSKKRYFGKDVMRKAFLILKEEKWVVVSQKPHAYFDKNSFNKGRSTTIQPSTKFRKIYVQINNHSILNKNEIDIYKSKFSQTRYEPDYSDNDIPPPLNQVTMKNSNKEKVICPNSEALYESKLFLKNLNDHNLKFQWHLESLGSGDPPWPKCLDDDGTILLSIPKAQIVYKRVFNNSSYEQGGRLYSGLITQLRSYQRNYLHADGIPLIELDFKGMQMTLLYALEKLELPKDPYSLGSKELDMQYPRWLRKEVMMMMINCSSMNELYSAMCGNPTAKKQEERDGRIVSRFRKWRNKVEHFWVGIKNVPHEIARTLEPEPDISFEISSIKEIHNHAISNHQSVSKHLMKGLGLYLQYRESEIMIRAAKEVISRGFPFVPVHDGALCTDSDALYQAMVNGFQKEMKVDFIPNIDNESEQFFRQVKILTSNKFREAI